MPEDFQIVTKDGVPINTTNQALRLGIIAELDAINLYENLAKNVDDEHTRKLFLDIAKEEKTHVGEFQTLLLKHDTEQAEEMIAGQKEVEDILMVVEDG